MTTHFRDIRRDMLALCDAARLDEEMNLLVITLRCDECGSVFVQSYEEAILRLVSGLDDVCLSCDKAAEDRTARPTVTGWFSHLLG